MRNKFLCFLRISVSKIPVENVSPKWIRFFGYILFPIKSFLLQRFDYDPCNNSVFIYGRRYSFMFFSMISEKEYPGEEWFQFVKNKETGIIELYKKIDTDFIHKDLVNEKIRIFQDTIDSYKVKEAK